MANVGDSFMNTMILTSLGVVAQLLNSLWITRLGYRRIMMMCGLAFCGLTQLLIAIVYTVEPGTTKAGKAVVGLAVLYIFGYNAMLAPYAWLSGGEIPSQRLRSYTFGFATAIGFFGAVSLSPELPWNYIYIYKLTGGYLYSGLRPSLRRISSTRALSIGVLNMDISGHRRALYLSSGFISICPRSRTVHWKK